MNTYNQYQYIIISIFILKIILHHPSSLLKYLPFLKRKKSCILVSLPQLTTCLTVTKLQFYLESQGLIYFNLDHKTEH